MKEQETNQTKKEGLRKTVYLDKGLFEKCLPLFPIAKTENFSEFVTKALDYYIDGLILGTHSQVITDDLKKAIDNAMAPLGSRISRGMYRYAIILDSILQILADGYDDFDIKALLLKANARVGRLKGKIDLKVLSEQKTHDYGMEEESEDGEW